MRRLNVPPLTDFLIETFSLVLSLVLSGVYEQRLKNQTTTWIHRLNALKWRKWEIKFWNKREKSQKNANSNQSRCCAVLCSIAGNVDAISITTQKQLKATFRLLYKTKQTSKAAPPLMRKPAETNTGNTNGPIEAPLINRLPKPAAVDFCAITLLSSPNQLQSLSKFCRMPWLIQT